MEFEHTSTITDKIEPFRGMSKTRVKQPQPHITVPVQEGHRDPAGHVTVCTQLRRWRTPGSRRRAPGRKQRPSHPTGSGCDNPGLVHGFYLKRAPPVNSTCWLPGGWSSLHGDRGRQPVGGKLGLGTSRQAGGSSRFVPVAPLRRPGFPR